MDIAIYAAAVDSGLGLGNISGIEYRRAAVDVYYLFFDQTQEQQEQDILHELVHIHQAVLLNIISDDLLPLVKNEQLKEYLERHIRKAIEYQTQGLALGVYNALHPPAATFGSNPYREADNRIPKFHAGTAGPSIGEGGGVTKDLSRLGE